MLAGRLAFRYAFRPPLSSECRSMSTQYDANNVFAKILRGEIPSHKLYEDEATFAFMDIMPRGQGHCLVIPKKPARNILDVEPDSLAAVAATAQKLARAVVKAFGADGVTIQQFNESAGGQVVFHLHVHVLPRFKGVALNPPGGPMEQPEVLAANAEKIRAALA
jgi:histidine triad (HIT) family protein